MNKTVIFLSLLLLSTLAVAQKPQVKNDPNHDDRPIHFGFSLGLNFMDYRVEHSDPATGNGVYVGLKEMSPGINIHALANLRLSERWDLRLLPGISFGERNMYFKNRADSSIYPEQNGAYYKANSAYIEVPLTFKYKSKRLNNFRPFIVGGANLRTDLAIEKDYDFRDQLFLIKQFDVYAELGLGLDSYMVFFKLGIELKYSFSLQDILLRTNESGELPEEYAPYTNAMKGLYSHMIILLFHFE